MTGETAILGVEDLRKRYGGKRGREGTTALDGVSFDLAEGETLGIVGESGSGKSTLARILVRLAPADGGVVHFRGVDVLRPDRVQARRLTREIQIVFQDPYSAMHPRHTVRQALREAARVAGTAEGDLDDQLAGLLDSVGVSPDKLTAYPHQLSGGQRQRIAIARALAVEPSIIIADECVSALDVSVQSSILNLLLELQQSRGLSYLFISHDLAVVNHMSDRIIVMKDGRIVESGHADEVINHPQESYTKELLSSLPGAGR